MALVAGGVPIPCSPASESSDHIENSRGARRESVGASVVIPVAYGHNFLDRAPKLIEVAPA